MLHRNHRARNHKNTLAALLVAAASISCSSSAPVDDTSVDQSVEALGAFEEHADQLRQLEKDSYEGAVCKGPWQYDVPWTEPGGYEQIDQVVTEVKGAPRIVAVPLGNVLAESGLLPILIEHYPNGVYKPGKYTVKSVFPPDMIVNDESSFSTREYSTILLPFEHSGSWTGGFRENWGQISAIGRPVSLNPGGGFPYAPDYTITNKRALDVCRQWGNQEFDQRRNFQRSVLSALTASTSYNQFYMENWQVAKEVVDSSWLETAFFTVTHALTYPGGVGRSPIRKSPDQYSYGDLDFIPMGKAPRPLRDDGFGYNPQTPFLYIDCYVTLHNMHEFQLKYESVSVSKTVKVDNLSAPVRKLMPPRSKGIFGAGLTLDQFYSKFSTLNQTIGRSDLGYQKPKCTTCDDIDIRTSEGVNRRIECIYWAEQFFYQNPQYVHYATGLHSQLQLLAVQRGHQINDGLRNYMLNVGYGKYRYSSVQVPSEHADDEAKRRSWFDSSVRLVRRPDHVRPHLWVGNAPLAILPKQFEYCKALAKQGAAKSIGVNIEMCYQTYRALVRIRAGENSILVQWPEHPKGIRYDLNPGEDAARQVLTDGVSDSFATDLVLARLNRDTSPFPRPSHGVVNSDEWTKARVEVKSRLGAVNDWYVLRRGILQADADRASGGVWSEAIQRQFDSEINEVIGALWKGLYGAANESEGQVGKVVAIDQGTLAKHGFAIDYEILAAVFDDKTDLNEPLPLAGGVLLSVVRDTLRGLTERLEEISVLHDLACRYRMGGCGPTGGSIASISSETWGLLASLADKQLLTQRIAQARGLDDRGTRRWLAIFKEINRKHSQFAQAIFTGLYDQGVVPSGWDSRVMFHTDAVKRAPVASLATLVARARAAHDRYTQTGFYNVVGNELAYPLTAAGRKQAGSVLSDKVLALDQLIKRYRSDEATEIERALALAANQRDKTAVLNRIKELVQRFDDLTSDLTGLKGRAAADDLKFADITAAYTKLLQEERDRIEYSFDRTIATVVREVSARDVIPADPSGMIPLLEVEKGDLVNFDVTGEWSPTCSLRNYQFPDGTAPSAAFLENVRTGPEGFKISMTGQEYSVSSRRTSDSLSHFDTHTHSVRTCSGWNLGIASPSQIKQEPTIVQGGWSLSTTKCDEHSSGTSHVTMVADENDNGTNSNTGISLVGGLTDWNNPFPKHATGSLLLVARKRGRLDFAPVNLATVKILQSPHSSVLATEPVDLFLKVNDSSSCMATGSYEVNDSRLSVRAQRLVPQRELLTKFASPLANVWQTLRSKRKEFVAQGQLLPSDASNLHSQSLVELQRECGCNVSEYPAFVKQFLSAWLGVEVRAIEAEVAIVTKERERRLLTHELARLDDDLRGNEEQSRYQQLLHNVSSRNIDVGVLRSAISDLARYASNVVYPVLQLRYPTALTVAQSDGMLRAAVDTLLNASWLDSSFGGSDTTSLAQSEVALTSTLAQTMSKAAPDDAITKNVKLFVSIPRFKVGAAGETGPECVPYRDYTGTRDPDWQSMECGKARQIWADLLDRTKPAVTFSVNPEDLYSSGTTSAALHCTRAAPTIRHMAWMVATDVRGHWIPFNERLKNPRVNQAAEMTFPTSQGPLTFNFTGNDRFGEVRFIAGESAAASARFEELLVPGRPDGDLAHMAGLSPFGHYSIQMADLRGPVGNGIFEDAYALVLMYHLETFPTDDRGLPGVAQCVPRAP